jgi:hypothetical protein
VLCLLKSEHRYLNFAFLRPLSPHLIHPASPLLIASENCVVDELLKVDTAELDRLVTHPLSVSLLIFIFAVLQLLLVCYSRGYPISARFPSSIHVE